MASGGQILLAPTSLTVQAGQAVCVVGPNGSGKTTLLRVLGGLQTRFSGAVLVAGRIPDLRRPGYRRAVSRLLSPVPFSFRLTVQEHLRLVALTWGFTHAEAAAAASGGLSSLLAEGIADRFPHQLSAGELQAASLAVALLRPFSVLLLDEPEQSLDAARLAALGAALAAVAEGGAAVVAATHSPALVQALGGAVVDLAQDRA